MADRRTTLLQCSLRIRRRRKWKGRWCTLTKLSPVSDQVILKFYKNKEAVESNKEIRREQIAISAQNFCGLSLAYRYSKNPFVLTVVCLNFVVLLSFENHSELLNWYHKIQNTLPSAAEFQTRVIVPNQPSKINPGNAILHFYDNHFALTPAIPKELIGSWSLSSLQKYTFVGDSIFFSAVTSKGEKTYVLVTHDVTVAENLKNHFDLATAVQEPPERLSFIPNTGYNEPSSGADGHPSNYQNCNHHGSSNGGSCVHRRNQEEYGTHVHDSVNSGSHRRDTYSNPVSRSSVGSRRQFDVQTSREIQYNESPGASVHEPLLHPSLHYNHSSIPLRDMGGGDGANGIDGDGDFGFWKPSSDGGHAANKEETSFLYDCLLDNEPTLPVREQNYEVMNLFDHIRHSKEEPAHRKDSSSHQKCAECGEEAHVEGKEIGSKDEGGEKKYMNLFTRRTHANQKSPDSNQNTVLPPLFIPENRNTIENHCDTLGHSSSVLPNKQFVNLNDMGSTSPSYFLTATRDEPKGIPVPFDHSSLVKPSGPIAMLKSSTSSPLPSSSTPIDSQDVKENVTPCTPGRDSQNNNSGYKFPAHRQRQHSYPAETDTTVPTPPRKYSMQLMSNSYSADTTDSPSSTRQPPYPPPRLPPREPFLPSPAPPYIRQRCYTDSAYSGRVVPSSPGSNSEHGYLMMKPAYEEKLSKMHVYRSKSVSSSPVDGAITNSPLGVASRVYRSHYRRTWDRSSASPSLVRSPPGRMDPSGRYLKRSATVATNLTRQGNATSPRDLSPGSTSGMVTRRGSIPSPSPDPSRRLFAMKSNTHMPRPRTSRDYASIDPDAVAKKVQSQVSHRSSQDDILAFDYTFNFSDTSGSGDNTTPFSSSLSDLSSQASHSRASSFGSQSGVSVRHHHSRIESKDFQEGDTETPLNDVNGNR